MNLPSGQVKWDINVQNSEEGLSYRVHTNSIQSKNLLNRWERAPRTKAEEALETCLCREKATSENETDNGELRSVGK